MIHNLRSKRLQAYVVAFGLVEAGGRGRDPGSGTLLSLGRWSRLAPSDARVGTPKINIQQIDSDLRDLSPGT